MAAGPTPGAPRSRPSTPDAAARSGHTPDGLTGQLRRPLPPPLPRAPEPTTAARAVPRTAAASSVGTAPATAAQPRSPGLFAMVSLAVVGLAAVWFVGALANGALSSSTQTAPPARTTPEFAPPAPTTTIETEPTTTAPETTEPTEPTESEPLPQQPSAPEPIYLLGDHPINADGLFAADTTACTLAPFSPDPAGQDALYQSAMPCMVDAWRWALETTNLPSSEPELITVSGPVETPCGTAQSSYYCSGNHTLYMSASVHAEQEQLGDQPGPYLSVLFHEYGHHVQGLSGIMQAAWDQRYEVGPNSPAGLEISRRLELQASCYGGMLLAATTRTGVVDLDTMSMALNDARNRGDWPDRGLPPDHGAPEINGGWMEQGYYENNTRQCNTWLAEPSAVR
ncbi:Putative neutral zinc metallopeptidase [Actinoalloteichus hymeniacidonis]|uniref:Neutral zinc metallopeptidase n=2 Tax=Actinoalloteichus hymeniacidonis TaxID=340345 RepID=A0AAC9MWY6_9PSEU|nr:Putative neutral zinc metallopeptidase [Actinoalloteichus hymeniacidonis]